MRAYLIQIDAWDGSTAVPLRLASHDDDRLCHLDGKTWWPAIATLPTLRYDFFDGGFDPRAITSPRGSFTAAIGAVPTLPALSLHDTRIRIWRGNLGDAWAAFSLMFDGRVKEQPATTDGVASISFGTDDSWLDQPLLQTYDGTGGADGSPDLEGQVKPLALGAPRFAPAVLVDAIDNIYQLSGYGAINAVEVAFDRLTRFGAAAGSAASFAALKDAALEPGQWGVALSGGYVRFGAPSAGMVSFHTQGDAVGGWARLPGDIIARIAAIAGGAGKYTDAAALNALRPWNLSLMVTAQTTARDLIQRIATSVNAIAYVDWMGSLRVVALGIGSPTMTMAADGSALPPVARIEQVSLAAPYWKVAQGAAVTWQVHGLNDIAFTAPLNPRGPYDHAETYREGDMVTLPNGSQWLFVVATPATGSAPSDGNPRWFKLSGPITAGNVTYADGQTLEDLKPAEAGATNGAPGDSPFGDETAQASLDGMRIGLAAQAQEALLNGTFRVQQETRQNQFLQILDQMGVNLGDLIVFISFLREVDEDGNAIWALAAQNSNGVVTGLRNLLTKEGISKISLAADILEMLDPNGGNPIRPFYYGLDNLLRLRDTLIDGNLMVTGTISTTKVQNNAISDADTATLGSPVAGNGSWGNRLSYTLTIPSSDAGAQWTAIAIVTASQSFPDGDRDWEARLLADGVPVIGAASGGMKSEDNFALSGKATWGPGSHTFTLEWKGQSGASLSGANMVVLWLKR